MKSEQACFVSSLKVAHRKSIGTGQMSLAPRGNASAQNLPRTHHAIASDRVQRVLVAIVLCTQYVFCIVLSLAVGSKMPEINLAWCVIRLLDNDQEAPLHNTVHYIEIHEYVD